MKRTKPFTLSKNRLPALLLAVIFILPALSCMRDDHRVEPQSPPQVILIYGDTRTNPRAHQKVVDAMLAMQPEIVFHTGDLVANGLDARQWKTFNEITAKLRDTAVFFPVLGNHERNSPIYFETFDLPNNERWYTVDTRDGIHFILLDSTTDTGPNSEQYKWLENDLRSFGQQAKFTVVLFHHPPFSTGHHSGDEAGIRETLVPLFQQYGVDLVLNGHDHCYERSLHNGIYYIVTGGGGAPLYSQKETSPYSQLYIKEYHFCKVSVYNGQLSVTAYSADLAVLDRITIDPR